MVDDLWGGNISSLACIYDQVFCLLVCALEGNCDIYIDKIQMVPIEEASAVYCHLRRI